MELEEVKVGLDILKRLPKVSPLKGEKLTPVRSIFDKPGILRMRVPLDKVEITHPLPKENAFWYKGKRIILTPEQEQGVIRAEMM